MQTGAHTLPRFDAVSDMRQVFHCKSRNTEALRLLDYRFTNFVVDLSHVPLFSAGDFAEQLSCALRAVGLETTAQGKMAVPLVAQPATAKEVAGTRGREIILSDIHAQHWTGGTQRAILAFDYQVEVPFAFTPDEFCLSRGARIQNPSLVLPYNHPHPDTPRKRIERHGFTSERVGTLVKMDARPAKIQGRDRGIFSYPAQFPLRLIRLANRKDRIARHLRAQGSCLPEVRVGEVVKRHPIPTAMLNHGGNKSVARLCVSSLQSRQLTGLFNGRVQLHRRRTLHLVPPRDVFRPFNVPLNSLRTDVACRSHVVRRRPQVPIPQLLLQGRYLQEQSSRCGSLQDLHRIRNCDSGGQGDKQMDVIWLQFFRENRPVALLANLLKQPIEHLCHFSGQDGLSVLWAEDHMVGSLIDAIAISSDIQHTHMVAMQPFRVKFSGAPPRAEDRGFRACAEAERVFL
jgi:hypothetical protein